MHGLPIISPACVSSRMEICFRFLLHFQKLVKGRLEFRATGIALTRKTES